MFSNFEATQRGYLGTVPVFQLYRLVEKMLSVQKDLDFNPEALINQSLLPFHLRKLELEYIFSSKTMGLSIIYLFLGHLVQKCHPPRAPIYKYIPGHLVQKCHPPRAPIYIYFLGTWCKSVTLLGPRFIFISWALGAKVSPSSVPRFIFIYRALGAKVSPSLASDL